MNRKILMMLALLLSATLIIGGCNSEAPSASASSASSASSAAPIVERNIAFSSGGSGGSFYAIMAAIMDFMPKEIPGLIITGFEGAPAQNLRMLEQNDAQIATVWSDQYAQALAGTGIFEGETFENLAALQTCTVGMQYFMTKASLPIEKVEDFKTITGITFSPGEVGSGLVVACQEIFKEIGFSFEEFEKNGNKIVYAAYGQYSEMLSDNQLDAFFISGGFNTPHNAVLQAELTTDLRVIAIEGDWVKALCARLPSMGEHTLPANIYKNQTTDVPVLKYYTLVACRKDMDEDFIYEFCKSNYNNTDKWIEVAPQIAEVLVEPTDYIAGFDPDTLHPGAARFWKEIGALS
jgi:TRAP transporter TAXI family solute receptor